MKVSARLVLLQEVVQINPPALNVSQGLALSGQLPQDEASFVRDLVGVPYVRLDAISGKAASIHPKRMMASLAQKSGRQYRAGDVLLPLIASGLSANKIAQADMQDAVGWCSPELHVLRSDGEQLLPRFLMHWLRFQGRNRLLALTCGTGPKPASINDAAQLPIPLLALPIQQHCVRVMDLMLKRRQLKLRELQLMDDEIIGMWQELRKLCQF